MSTETLILPNRGAVTRNIMQWILRGCWQCMKRLEKEPADEGLNTMCTLKPLPKSF